MPRAAQLHALTDYALQLHAANDYSQIARLAVEAAMQLVPCDGATLTFTPTHFPMVSHRENAGDVDWDRYYREILSVVHDDPVYTHRLRLLLDRPATSLEFRSQRAFNRTSVYQQIWRPIGVERVVNCVNPGPLSQALLLTRSHQRDFTRDEITLLHLLSRHIPAATQRLIDLNGGRLPVGDRLIGVEHFCWLVCNREGVVLRSGNDARSRMRLCLGPTASLDRLPAEWQRELERRAAGHPPTAQRYRAGRRSFSVHIAPIRESPGEFSVVFVEYPAAAEPLAPLLALGLTQREAEVMREVIGGQTNAEIGASLGISAATAKKHVENVLEKLGVPSRAAAVAHVLTAIQSAA